MFTGTDLVNSASWSHQPRKDILPWCSEVDGHEESRQGPNQLYLVNQEISDEDEPYNRSLPLQGYK